MNITTAQSAIKAAFICGIISTFITLVATAVGIYRSGIEVAGIQLNALLLIDVGIMLGFTIGLYFKNRGCAIGMLVYFLISKGMQWSRDFNPASIVTGLVFLYFYARGAWGSVVFHRLKIKEPNQALEPTTMAVTPPAAQEPRQP